MKKRYFCVVCDKEVAFIPDNGGHIKKYHSDGEINCPKCDKIFQNYKQGWCVFVSTALYELSWQ